MRTAPCLCQLTAAELPRAGWRLLPELLRPAASRVAQPQEWELPEQVSLAVQELEPAAGPAEQGLGRELVPMAAVLRAVAMRVQARQGPAAAAQTAGPVLRGRLRVAGPTVPLAVRERVQLPTVRQQELHQ